jgi:hypothetical protein
MPHRHKLEFGEDEDGLFAQIHCPNNDPIGPKLRDKTNALVYITGHLGAKIRHEDRPAIIFLSRAVRESSLPEDTKKVEKIRFPYH